MLTTKVPNTVDDLMKLPPETRAELIEGEIFMSPSPNAHHQRVVRNIVEGLLPFLRQHPIGSLFFAPLDVVLSRTVVVQPDVLFLSSARGHIVGDRIEGAPDLAVEVVSPGTDVRDRTVKRGLYARHGVREYWIVELDARTVEVLTLKGNEYALHAVFEPGDTITSQILAGLQLPLDPLFE